MKIATIKLSALRLIFCLLTTGCGQTTPQTQSGVGINDFKRAIISAYQRLISEKVKKKDGFYNECSVEFGMDHGIRVSETVCESDENTWDVTIRVTDPATRPPSQRRKDVSIELENFGRMNLARGISQKTDSGVMLLLDRTGQSVVLTANIDR